MQHRRWATILTITVRLIAETLIIAMTIGHLTAAPWIIAQTALDLSGLMRSAERIILGLDVLKLTTAPILLARGEPKRITVLLSARRLITEPIMPALGLPLLSTPRPSTVSRRIQLRLRTQHLSTTTSHRTNISPLYLCGEPNLLS